MTALSVPAVFTVWQPEPEWHHLPWYKRLFWKWWHA